MKIQIEIDLDAELFRVQRNYLGRLIMSGVDMDLFTDTELELLQGLEALNNEIADQAHDIYGLPTLYTDQDGEAL